MLAAQAVRAFSYGLGSVLLASTLAQRGLSSISVGVVLGSLVAGTVIAQTVIGRWADSFGRRRSYQLMYLLLGVVGLVFASTAPLWVLVAVTLTGALSAEVIESGPFTTLELSMLSGRLRADSLAAGFGWYNAIAAAAGSLGALAAALPEVTRRVWDGAPSDRAWFLLLVPIAATGIVIARRLSPLVEVTTKGRKPAPLGPSRPAVTRLAGLFAIDAFAGGFVVQTFIAFWLIDRFHATTASVGGLLAAIGAIQTLSFLAAPLIARRWGLLNTMVFTHLPSNLLLAAVAFAPNLPVAAGFLLARSALSQMDVPTRQAYVMTLVEPEERTAAIAYTNTARYIVRPIGPLFAGAAVTIAAGAPFIIAGALKSLYDLTLWGWFRTIPLSSRKETTE
ncbi:MAG TPA: MFS transporter [Acidimicrobiia bacterium]|nr:MFS transporter [Acidimicrobiia bacterium]